MCGAISVKAMGSGGLVTSVGSIYDLDKDQGGEELRIDLQGRTAEKGHIVYSSKTWSQQFEYEPWGSFQAVAFLGKPYFAGYPESNFTRRE